MSGVWCSRPSHRVDQMGRDAGQVSGFGGHCQLKQEWYPPTVGGAAVRCGEVLGTPIGVPPLKREGPRRSTRPS